MSAHRAPRHVPLAALCLPFCLLVPTAALAHGGRLPLDQWGGYGGDLLRCQRVIARAAGQCAAGTWALRRACRETELAGGTCDETATKARIGDVQRSAQDKIDAVCSERQVTDLQFLGSFDLQEDLVDFCRAWETAADSGVFGAAGAAPGTCTEAAARAVSEVLYQTLRVRRRCMDRMAASPPGAAERAGLRARADRRLAAIIDHATAALAAACPDFTARYGRAPRAFIETLATRADCIGGTFYLQEAILCPPAVCGNGVVEPTEECDDGNSADGDGCSSTCLSQ